MSRRPPPHSTGPPTASALSPRALYQDVAERLRQQIFERALEPGSWIDEQRLATAWGISRTPLREALKVLAVEGLVTMNHAAAPTWRRHRVRT
jgi:DNA-binding GntR family transcriptional regulator